MTQVKNLQFPRYFLQNEVKVNPQLLNSILDVKIKVSTMGEPDTVSVKGDTLSIAQPSSLTRFLFSTLYQLLKNYTHGGMQQDKLSLGLLYACKNYVYSDYNQDNKKTTPVLISFDKLHIPSLIIKELVEPITKKVKTLPVMFMPSNSNDVCEIIDNQEKFAKKYKLPHRSVSFDYPVLVVNNILYNKAAQNAHITTKILEYSFGEQDAHKIVKNILLDENNNFASYLLSIVKILEGDPIFILDFLKFFTSNVTLSTEEETKAFDVRKNTIANDKYLKNNIKLSQKHTPDVFRQWHQWSLIVGLIEKQLAPMRGSMWPTTEKVGPFEEKQRQMAAEEAAKKGKTQLNFEELLELARTWYSHKAVQPGELYEKLLTENRVWKT